MGEEVRGGGGEDQGFKALRNIYGSEDDSVCHSSRHIKVGYYSPHL